MAPSLMQPGSSTFAFCTSLCKIREEESGSHICQLGSLSHFPNLGRAPQASCLSVALQALLQEPLAFCLHRCIIPLVS